MSGLIVPFWWLLSLIWRTSMLFSRRNTSRVVFIIFTWVSALISLSVTSTKLLAVFFSFYSFLWRGVCFFFLWNLSWGFSYKKSFFPVALFIGLFCGLLTQNPKYFPGVPDVPERFYFNFSFVFWLLVILRVLLFMSRSFLK